MILYLVCSRSNAGFLRDVPALLTARFGARVVVHAHGSDIIDLLTNRPLSPLARWLYAPCTLVLPSHHLTLPLSGIRLAGLVVIENFANVRISGTEAAKPSSTGPLTLLWNSNLMASKGAFDMLAAAAELQRHGLALDVHVVGAVLGDEEMSVSLAEATFEDLQKRLEMTYHGRVDAERAGALLAAADVVALPSRYASECQPLTVVEAMCAGKAIIISNIPALHATIGGYPAEVVPVRSVSAIRDALLRLDAEKRADPQAFVSRRAQSAAAARDRFSTNRFDVEMATILQSAAVPAP